MTKILSEIQSALCSLKKPCESVLLALDGRCAAGKTTLAGQLEQELGFGVIHMDDFFLRPEQRTSRRLAEVGGNVDWERFRAEVLLPLKQGVHFSYRPYDCHTQTLGEVIEVKPRLYSVVEGSYSCHPKLWDFYDLHIFLTIGVQEQLRRIQSRNGEAGLDIFQKKWIPLEEQYFKVFSIQKRCELCFDTEQR